MTNPSLQCVAANAADQDFLQSVAERVFGAYTGGRKSWKLEDSSNLWNIHSGERAKVLGVQIGGCECCVKLFYDDRLFVLIRNRMGWSKAQRAYSRGLKLALLGLRCPEMIGFAVCRKSGLALLVTELIEDACQVDHWLEKNGANEEVLNALGRFAVQMHNQGVLHKDLSPRNLLIDSVEGSYTFTILDYEDLSFHAKVTDEQRVENLRHLYERLMRTLPEEKLGPFLNGCGQDTL